MRKLTSCRVHFICVKDFLKMVYSSYKQQRILYFANLGNRSTAITQLLRKEGLNVCRSGVWRFLKKYEETGSVVRRPGSGRPTRITSQVLEIVEKQMQKDDETTAVQLQRILVESGHPLSLKTILRS